MPHSSGAWVRTPIWMEWAGLTMPSRTARVTKVPCESFLPSSAQVSWCASNWTKASGPYLSACALSSGQVQKWSPPSEKRCTSEIEDRLRLRLDRLGDGQRAVQVERDVAVIDRGELAENVDPEGVLRVAVEDRRGAADRLRPEAGARPVRHRHVERDAEDREIHAGQVAAVAPAHEGERAGIGRVGRAALQRL